MSARLFAREGASLGADVLFAVAAFLTAAVSCLVTAVPSLAQTADGKPQLIWFAPRDHALDDGNGSFDYRYLFAESSPWTQAASHVQIFKFYSESIVTGPPYGLTDAELRQAFADLQRRHILLAVETAMLTRPADGHCGNAEGFFGGDALALPFKIKALGGNLDYIAMDEPFQHAVETQCNWTPQQVAENAAQNIASIKSIFPNVKVGDIEIVPSPDMLTQYAAWFDALRVATGEPLAFFHADDSSAPIAAIEAVRQIVEERQIPFGIIYDGLYSDQSDGDWINHAQSHYESIETVGKIIPDHVIFQSWHPYPKYVLPESDPTRFTHLINTYFRTRTALSIVADQEHVAGRLTDNQGTPIPAVPITVKLRPTTGSGVISSYTLTGTVPPSITKAVIQIGVNDCGANPHGTNDLSIYSFQYADSGGNMKFDFSQGLDGWVVQGDGTGSVLLASDVNGNSILISATPAQETSVTSPTFTVAPGSSFTLTMQGRVGPGSTTDSSCFALIFLVDQEVSRATLPLSPGTATLGVVQTGADGTFGLAYTPPNDTGFALEANYSGSDSLWPAFATTLQPTPTNYQGLWWASPAGSESGWGINFAHQGDTIFATWFTYDAAGKGLWLVMTAPKTGAGVYSGTLYTTKGPPFNAAPFNPAQVVATAVGAGTLTFADANDGTFSYTVNGVAQNKAITREVFGTLPVCATATGSLTAASNYTDLWWASPAGSESGWGINLTQESTTIFATWFTYDLDGTPMWLVVTAPQTMPGLFSGTLYRTTGPVFNSVPFDPSKVVATNVGTATFTFNDGNNATFAYTVNGIAQAKAITREVFANPGTVCQ